MADSREQANPGKGFRLVTNDGKEKFLPIPMPLTKAADLFRIEPSEPDPPPVPLAQGDGQPPSEPPAAPPGMMEPMPEPERRSEESDEAKIARLEGEHTDLLSALYWVQTQIAELKEKSGQ
jgi:hypothetical protein